MRTFLAIDIDPAIRSRLSDFIDSARNLAPEARWGRPESLHITLLFLGEISPDDADRTIHALQFFDAPRFDLTFRGHGFFTPQKPRVFFARIESPPALAALAKTLKHTLLDLGIAQDTIARERDREFHPHLTLARLEPRTRTRDSGRLASKWAHSLAELPHADFGTMAALEFSLFESRPHAGGSEYIKLARFALR